MTEKYTTEVFDDLEVPSQWEISFRVVKVRSVIAKFTNIHISVMMRFEIEFMGKFSSNL